MRPSAARYHGRGSGGSARAEDFDAAFYSIGSNDLTQYTMAAARDIGAVADLNDAGHPAVLALIARTVEAARKRDVEVSLCGDAARRHPPDDGAALDRPDDPLGGTACRWRGSRPRSQG